MTSLAATTDIHEMRLQVKLFIIIAPCGILCSLLMYLFTHAGLYERSSREMLDEMKLAMSIAEGQYREFITAAETDIKLLSGTTALHEYAAASKLHQADAVLPESLRRTFEQIRQTHPEYLALQLLQTGGTVDLLSGASRPAAGDQNTSQTSTQSRQEADGQLALPNRPNTAIHTNATTRQSLLSITLPLNTEASEFFLGYEKNASTHSDTVLITGHLLLVVDLALLAEKFTFDFVSEETVWSVVNDDGQIVLHANRELIGTLDPELLTEGSYESSDGTVINRLYRNNLMIVGRHRLDDNTSLVTMLPDAAVRQSIAGLSRKIAIIASASVLMGIAAFLALLRVLVLQPLIKLRQVAMTIGLKAHNNILHATMDMTRRDEIGDLSRAFKDSSERLQASMSELQDSHSQIESLAYRDTLTGLANRLLFNQLAEKRISDAREQKQQLCILFLDLDDFKRINDTQGHKAGDKLLETVAKRLQTCLVDAAAASECSSTFQRNDYTIARMGGDEFIALIPHTENGNEGEKAAARILKAFSIPITLNGIEFVVSSSIGIALYPTHADTVDNLIKCADAAMYEAKRLNKNNYRLYGSTIQQMLEERMKLEIDLRQAIARNELSLVYQPQYSIHDMELFGAEALLRWNHAERGLIPPDQFIPIAEERDLIHDIGKWVLVEACRQWKEWQTAGTPLNQIAVNVSARQFTQGNMLQMVEEVLQQFDMPASALELELTESCIVEAPVEVFNTLSALKASGIAIAMDDFGTGYSSLSAIATMPVDTLKIDRSFITNLKIGSSNEKIVSAILMLANSLKLQVVAEGVEQKSELDFLRSKKCQTAQGYYMARPLSVQDMTALLSERAVRKLRRSA